jgi:TolB-like protein/Tfp pilus assembly protein PilF
LAEPDIFISYNREDAAIAQTYRDAFEALGFAVWWDATLRPGETYDEITERALRAAKAVIVLWSPRSVASRWVRAEATIADRNNTLVPVTIEACERPVMFELTQTADLCHWRGDPEDREWLAFLTNVQCTMGQGDEPSGQATRRAFAPPKASASSGWGMPKVAVLPITFRANEDGMEYLAEDLTEEITRELAVFPLTTTIAASTMATWRGKVIDNRSLCREVGAHFLVEGKLQRVGENVRLTLQLIDAESVGVMWSSRLTRKLADIEACPEALPVAAAAEIGDNLLIIEVGRAMTKAGSFSAWDHVLRYTAYAARLGPDAVRGQIEEARLALAAAPDLGMAHAMLAASLALQATFLGKDLDETEIHEIQVHIKSAMQLDGNNFQVCSNLTNAYHGLGEYETALRLARRHLELAPNSSATFLMLGISHLYLGHIDEATTAFKQHERLSSFDAARYLILTHLGICYLLNGQVSEADEVFDQSLSLHPGFHLALKWKAIAAAQLGAEGEALDLIKQLRSAEPELRIERHVRQVEKLGKLHDRTPEAVATLHRLWDMTEREPAAN